MTTLSFEIETTEVSKIKAVLKALGVQKIKIEPNTRFEELSKRVKEAREEKSKGKLTDLDIENLWENI